ncbi:MAG: AAA family ATPase [Flavobacteriaceae bacterium]
MDITINDAPQDGEIITIPQGMVTILIGENGSGKSKILESIKKQKKNEVILLKNNYQNVSRIENINIEQTITEQKQRQNPINVASIVAGDPELFQIFQYYFKAFFNLDLTIEGNNFKTGNHNMIAEADGLKSMFNIIYYLISPHSFILLDEPERFFHPSLSLMFLNLISGIAKNYDKRIVITTHSPKMMRFEIANTKIYRINKNPSEILDINNWISNLNNENYQNTRHKSIFKDWFYFHSELIFAKSVLLVEGVSDQIVIDALKQRLSFDSFLESVTIEHVASSNHEGGGKAKLHKIQTFLSSIIQTFSLADRDIVENNITKWYNADVAKDAETLIEEAKTYNLFVLPKGDLEDYFFIDESYNYCKTIERARANKISASYEQARIILSKPIEEIYTQFKDLIEYLKIIRPPSEEIDNILKGLVKDYIIEKHAKNNENYKHLTDYDEGDNYTVSFLFTDSSKGFKYPKAELEKIKSLSNQIDENLIN